MSHSKPCPDANVPPVSGFSVGDATGEPGVGLTVRNGLFAPLGFERRRRRKRWKGEDAGVCV